MSWKVNECVLSLGRADDNKDWMVSRVEFNAVAIDLLVDCPIFRDTKALLDKLFVDAACLCATYDTTNNGTMCCQTDPVVLYRPEQKYDKQYTRDVCELLGSTVAEYCSTDAPTAAAAPPAGTIVQSTSSSSTNSAVLWGSVGGVFGLALLLGVATFLWRRRHYNNNNKYAKSVVSGKFTHDQVVLALDPTAEDDDDDYSADDPILHLEPPQESSSSCNGGGDEDDDDSSFQSAVLHSPSKTPSQHFAYDFSNICHITTKSQPNIHTLSNNNNNNEAPIIQWTEFQH